MIKIFDLKPQLTIFTVLWLLDTLFTLIFVNIDGLQAEANPIIRMVFLYTGNLGFIFVKFSSLLLFLYNTWNIKFSWVRIASIILNIIMLSVVTLGAYAVYMCLI